MKILGKIIPCVIAIGILFLIAELNTQETKPGRYYDKETNQIVVQYSNPTQWENEQRNHWMSQLNSAKLLYQEEYNATKDAVEVLVANNNLLFGKPSLSSIKLEAQLHGVLLTNLSDMADYILLAQHKIMTEPLAGEMTRYEVLKYRLLVKSNYVLGGKDYSSGFVKDSNNDNAEPLYDEWLYSLSCLGLNEKSANKIVEEAGYEGKVSYNYLNKHTSATQAIDNRVAEFRQLLRVYYDSVEKPSISYNDFEVWACCFFLYNKDFDFETIQKIIADKTIVGNVKLKPNTGSPIIL